VTTVRSERALHSSSAQNTSSTRSIANTTAVAEIIDLVSDDDSDGDPAPAAAAAVAAAADEEDEQLQRALRCVFSLPCLQPRSHTRTGDYAWLPPTPAHQAEVL
jgi:hypothetical protein